jgi:hypothetical protein
MAALLATTGWGAAAALLPGAGRAQDATWLASPGSGDYNTAANWNPAAVPTGTASFGTSSVTSVSFSADTNFGGWTFNSGAPAYTFTNGQFLNFTGAGIVINGGSASITNNHDLDFNNGSTAGSANADLGVPSPENSARVHGDRERPFEIASQRGVGAITVLSITMASRFERAFTGVARSATLFSISTPVP